MLLAVAERLAGSSNAAHQQTVGAVRNIAERYYGSAVRTDTEVDRLRINLTSAVRLGQYHTRLAFGHTLSGVEYAGLYPGLVAYTDETRHIGLHHHLLCSNDLAPDDAAEHISRMGHTYETPRGETARQGKREAHRTILVSEQSRIEERRLVEILAHLHFLSATFVTAIL